jgi:hypothetical protein
VPTILEELTRNHIFFQEMSGAAASERLRGRTLNRVGSQPAEQENPMNNVEQNKQTVIAFYTRAFNDKQPADAVAKYVGSEYIQHNPNTPDGAEAFIKNITGVISKFPQLSVAIARAWTGPENLELCDTECFARLWEGLGSTVMVEYSMMPSSSQCSVTSAAAIQ